MLKKRGITIFLFIVGLLLVTIAYNNCDDEASFQLDSDAPSLESISSEQSFSLNFSRKPGSTAYIGETVNIRFYATIPKGNQVKSYQCLFNGNDFPCDGNTTYPFLVTETGDNSFQVTVFDDEGNSISETLNWKSNVQEAARQVYHTIEANPPIDILFVVDTSGSMDEERRNLAQRIDGFLNQLNNLDWQVAATTTDMQNSYSDHSQGRLTDFGENIRILDSSVASAQELFGNKIQGFSRGSGNEKGIEAAQKAIERYVNGELPNEMFFRNEGHLAIVVLSDEDENSNGRNIRYTPEQFLDYVNTAFNFQKNITWHSIVKPSDGRCGGKRETKYEQLSKLTNGIIGSVCENDYTNQLRNIGQSVRNMQKEIPLGCTPLDSDLDGSIDIEVRFKPPGSEQFSQYNIPYKVQGQKLIFSEYFDIGQYELNFNCAQ